MLRKEAFGMLWNLTPQIWNKPGKRFLKSVNSPEMYGISKKGPGSYKKQFLLNCTRVKIVSSHSLQNDATSSLSYEEAKSMAPMKGGKNYSRVTLVCNWEKGRILRFQPSCPCQSLTTRSPLSCSCDYNLEAEILSLYLLMEWVISAPQRWSHFLDLSTGDQSHGAGMWQAEGGILSSHHSFSCRIFIA